MKENRGLLTTELCAFKNKFLTFSVSVVCFLFCIPPCTALAEEPKPLLPVAEAKNGFFVKDSYKYREMYSSGEVLNPGEGFGIGAENVYYHLHWEDIAPVNIVRRSGPIQELPHKPNSKVGKVKATTGLGELELDALIADMRSRIQGVIVLHEGHIVYEEYPGMRDNDNHIWYSVSKTLPSLMLMIFEAQGKIDFNDPIGKYLERAKGTKWEGIRVIDILDMASGLDIEETDRNFFTDGHTVNLYFMTGLGAKIKSNDFDKPGYLNADDVLFAADDLKDIAPGTIFQYSSLNTMMLTFLAEEVSDKRFTELLTEYLWSIIGPEGDAFMGLTPQTGSAGSDGLMNSRLRDLARYGLLYTPTGRKLYGKKMVETWNLKKELLIADKIFDSCRPALYQAAAEASEDGTGDGGFFGSADPEIKGNSLQWDTVYHDGDMYKAGVAGQSLFISPGRDVVVAVFSTTDEDWEVYGRAISKSFENAQ